MDFENTTLEKEKDFVKADEALNTLLDTMFEIMNSLLTIKNFKEMKSKLMSLNNVIDELIELENKYSKNLDNTPKRKEVIQND